MATSSKGALIHLLLSPASGGFSPALLALRRWGHGFLKPVSIGLMVWVVVLHLGSVKTSVETSTLRQIEANRVNVEQIKVDQSAAAKMAILTVDKPHDLSARMTHYRFTRAQLSAPRIAETP